MKKVTVLMGMLLALVLFSACSRDDEMNFNEGGGTVLIPLDSLDESLKSLPENDYTGRLYYEEYTDKWVIIYHHPGSIDGNDCYYPMNLPDEFKVNKEEMANISFSGIVVEMTDEDIQTLRITPLGGHHYYFVYLTKIVVAE